MSCFEDAIIPFWCSIFCPTSVTRIVMKPSFLLLLLAFILVVQGNMSMLSNKSKASKTFVAFRCNYCKGEYRTQRAYDCHRRHPTYVHTPCADARNQRSITFTERADLSTGILQEHAVSYFGNLCHNVLVIFAAMASTMHGTFILHDTSLHIMTLNYK